MGNWTNMVFLHLGPPAVSSGLFLLGTADLELHCIFLLRTLDQAVSLMSSIFSREHTSFSPLPLALLCPLILKCAVSSVVVPLFPVSNSSILCTSELSFPQYLRIVICLPPDILNCFLSWLIRLHNRLCSCWFQLVTPLSVQMRKILLATAWILQDLTFQISEYAVSAQTSNGGYRQKQKTHSFLSLQWQFKEKSTSFIQQRLADFCLSTWRFAMLKYHWWWSWFLWPLALKVKSEVTEDRKWKEVSEKQWAKCSWQSQRGTSRDTWFSPQMGIRGVLWKKWLNEAESSRTWPKIWSRGGIFKINLKFKMYCIAGVGCVVNGFPAHLENHWWRPHFKWLYIQRCLKQYFCFLFWILLLYFIIFPSARGSVIFCWAPLHPISVWCDRAS